MSHLFVSLVLVGTCASIAAADTFNFASVQIANNSVGGQLSVMVTAPSSSSSVVDFTFRNNAGVASALAEIYFSAGNTISDMTIRSQSAGVSFFRDRDNPSNPRELPASPSGFATSTISGSSNQASLDSVGGNGNASTINAVGETLVVRLTFSGRTFADVISSMNQATADSWFRIGVHVRAIASYGDGSLSFVNAAPPLSPPEPVVVPLPPAAYTGVATIAGIAGLGFLRRRRAMRA